MVYRTKGPVHIVIATCLITLIEEEQIDDMVVLIRFDSEMFDEALTRTSTTLIPSAIYVAMISIADATAIKTVVVISLMNETEDEQAFKIVEVTSLISLIEELHAP